MIYKVNEIFDSIQGEGIDTGKYCSFVRLAGCNMKCDFCDTEHEAKMVLDEVEISRIVNNKNIIITGGEPCMQDILPLVQRLFYMGKDITIETNGTFEIDDYIKKVCSISFSPKVFRSKCKLSYCDSLKIIYPWTNGIEVSEYEYFPSIYKSIQVISPEKNPQSIIEAIEIVKGLPGWRLGIQLHKLIGVK
jgi:organic radical activating enzyme